MVEKRKTQKKVKTPIFEYSKSIESDGKPFNKKELQEEFDSIYLFIERPEIFDKSLHCKMIKDFLKKITMYLAKLDDEYIEKYKKMKDFHKNNCFFPSAFTYRMHM